MNKLMAICRRGSLTIIVPIAIRFETHVRQVRLEYSSIRVLLHNTCARKILSAGSVGNNRAVSGFFRCALE